MGRVEPVPRGPRPSRGSGGAPADVERAWGPHPGRGDQSRSSAASDRGRGGELRATSSRMQQATDWGRGGIGADGLGRLQRPAPGEDGEAPEQGALGLVQEGVTPVHRGPHRLLAGEGRRVAGAEQPERLPQAGGQVLRIEAPGARGGQLQGQGQAVQAPADLGDGGGVVGGEGEVRRGLLRPLHEEAHGGVAQQGPGLRRRFPFLPRRGHGQGRHRAHVLPREARGRRRWSAG